VNGVKTESVVDICWSR